MGNLLASCRVLHRRLTWGGVPDTDRTTYFSEQLMCGWYELLCCPEPMGCTVRLFEPKNETGGEARYNVQMRLSHSENVPRYQVHITRSGRMKQWIVGHLEKTETHLRGKPGEFIRVQVWKLCSNSLHIEQRRSALQRTSYPGMNAVKRRATPSASDMRQMGMVIVTQASMDLEKGLSVDEPLRLDKSTEKWVQTIAVDDKAYKVQVDPPHSGGHYRSLKSINSLKIMHKGKKVCLAKKQRFAGAIGKMEHPFLGVQLKPSEKTIEQDEEDDEENLMKESLLDTDGLMLLLICMAWSEETMSDQSDMTANFVKAMRRDPANSTEADDLAVQWDTSDVKKRLRHVPYASFYDWKKSGLRQYGELPARNPREVSGQSEIIEGP
eukprot:TRINITY_DN37850_c0_g1_i1.p1 TRINITY_DN37850_c0_g1~~TRINITY_DN37850_c0_g1_i1.p1  ORF type:complete len:381 (+),score=70.74 TRINITY_DN37850_c0_g1_i1:121-1263(+)